MMKKIVAFGASSDIAKASLRSLVEDSSEELEVLLVGRSEATLTTIASDLSVRGCDASSVLLKDVSSDAERQTAIEEVVAKIGIPDRVFVCFGAMPDQPGYTASSQSLEHVFDINTTSQLALVAEFAKLMSAQPEASQEKPGIVVVSSVAGMRGRRTNYLYGASKAAVSTYLEGLRIDLQDSIVVTDVRPGLVRTRMTQDMETDSPLWTDDAVVGKKIAGLIRANRGGVSFVPGFWRLIMLIVRHIPYAIFRKLNF